MGTEVPLVCDHEWTSWIRAKGGAVAVRRCRKCLLWERKGV